MSKRRNFSSQQKVRILREHLVERTPVSDICDKHNLNVNLFYRWMKEFFENGYQAFEKPHKGTERAQAKKFDKLEDKLRHKDSVIAEIIEEHIKLKKNLGED